MILYILSFFLLLVGCNKRKDFQFISLEDVNDFVYQLQNIDLEKIGSTAFDLVIIDYSRDGSDEMRFSSKDIDALKNSLGGPKIVIAYMSIGEAENYRWYWKDEWDANHDGIPDSSAPSWLGPENPNWKGNYKVRYWENGWKSIIYGSPDSYLDKIIDAYEYWLPERPTAEREMVDFVKEIAHYARVIKGKTNFIVIPQNGEKLSAHEDYVNIISGIGREDVWYNGNNPNPPEEVDEVIHHLDIFKNAGKKVLVIDYVREQNLIDDFYSKAISKGYVPYATTRGLDSLIINPGHEPD
ncbi:MAG: MJ1477/TM1410 family putative glycoside hydrolase [candidate division WOR-3 bacterium]